MSVYRKSWKWKNDSLVRQEIGDPTHKVAHHFSAHFCLVKTPSIAIWGQTIQFFMKLIFPRYLKKRKPFCQKMMIFVKLSKFLEFQKKKRSKYWKLIGYTRRLVFLGSRTGIRIDTKWHHMPPNYFLKRRISNIFRRASFCIFQENRI